jgi:hypothetical protein
MEMITQDVLKRTTSTTAEAASAANDNRRKDRRLTPSKFPRDTVARIFRPARSAMTSGKARTKGWQLVFERRSAPYVEPLMGWTADDDPLATSRAQLSDTSGGGPLRRAAGTSLCRADG